MDFQAIYSFLFESYAGMGVLFATAIVVCLIACFIMEKRTRKRFVDRGRGEDDWSFFDDDDEEEENAG